MPLTLREFEVLSKSQRDTEILNAWLTLGAGAMTSEEKRYNEAKSKPQRDAEILAAILAAYTAPVVLTPLEKRAVEAKSQSQRDTEIWNAIMEFA